MIILRNNRGFFQFLANPSFWSAAAPIVAGVGASLIGAESQADTNSAQTEASNQQMAFQERMARNAHQYEVEDLRKAGLNPILSAKYGGSATPSGSMPILNAPYKDIGRDVNSAVNSAMQNRLNKSLIDTESSKQLANSAAATRDYSIAHKTQMESIPIEMEAAYRRSFLGRNMYAAKDVAGIIQAISSSLRDLGISGMAVNDLISRMFPQKGNSLPGRAIKSGFTKY